MNRRSFFKSIAFLTGGVAIAPTIFIPKLIEAPKWKAISGIAEIITNPETRMYQALQFSAFEMPVDFLLDIKNLSDLALGPFE